MYTPRKKTNVVSAGIFSLSVHAMIIGMLFLSFHWKQSQPVMNVAEVTLWDSLPAPFVKPEPVPEPVVVEEKVIEEKVEEKPEVVEPKPVEEQKKARENEIALKKKEEEKKKKLEEARIKKEKKKAKALKKKKLLAKLQKELKAEKTQKEKDAALKKLQEQSLSEEKAANDAKAAKARASANASIVEKFTNKIRNKIRGHVNKALCGNGNPELKFKIGLLPTGQLTGDPTLIQSSGLPACDEAVERAIRASEPLPLPSDKSLFSEFRRLKLTFKPNE